MKYLINPYLRSFLILGAWFLCVRKIYIEFDHSYFFDELAPTLLIFFASSVSLLSFLVDYGRYKVIKKPILFIPTVVSLLCITSLIVTYEKLKQQDRTPTILYASKVYGGFSYISIDFRENGTYKCKKNTGLMGHSYSIRGKYIIKDSIIQLDKSNIFDLIESDRLLMKTILKSKQEEKGKFFSWFFKAPKRDTLPETYLFQINHKGDTIKSAIAFWVNENQVGYHE